MKCLIIGWVALTVLGCICCTLKGDDKLKVMSCRSTLKKYKRLDDADNKSMF